MNLYIAELSENPSIAVAGLDVHTRQITVCILQGTDSEEFQVSGDGRGVKRLIKRLKRLRAVACYEAGPTGFGLQRKLDDAGIPCFVIAPSLIPRKAGDRVKTDRRDARKLAQYLRTGILTEVRVPTPEEEAVRDLVRLRDARRSDVKRAKQRLGKFLLRKDRRRPPKVTAWTVAHRNWLRGLKFDDPVAQFVFDDYLGALVVAEERLKAVVARVESVATTEPWAAPVGWLRCLRGVDTITALTLVAELHGFERFHHPRQLMSFLGLTPGEYSTDSKRRQGGITKAGNSLVRRLLIEAAHHARRRPVDSRDLKKRREGQPEWAVAIARRAQHRMYRRYWQLEQRGKAKNKIVVAVARELVGFIWALLHQGKTNACIAAA